MSGQPVPRLSVVVAVQGAAENLAAILAVLGPALGPDVELLLVHAEGEAGIPAAAPAKIELRWLSAPRGSLIPHLWRDGILASRAERVATLSAACLPAADWAGRALAARMDGLAGIGGAILDDPANDPLGRAVTMQRYFRYGPSRPPGPTDDIAADNAVYDRRAILAEADLLGRGFFEPGFHARFRQHGLGLAYDPTLRVVHRNRYTASAYVLQRMRHGFAFGRDRAFVAGPARRLLLLAAAPVLPLLFLRKIRRGVSVRPDLRPYLLRATPWLALFVLAWGCGETTGTVATLARAGRR